MSNENINNASDKLSVIDYKLGLISGVIMYLNPETAQFNENDFIGFGMILRDLQEEVKEAKKLLD